MNVKKLFADALAQLKEIMPLAEAQSQLYLLLEYYVGLSKMAILTEGEREVSPHEQTEFEKAVSRLLQHEPVQHIIGHSHFYGRDFYVTKDVLIPRQETEELVHWIIQENSHLQGLKILDIGTGSGIIPISLALELPGSQLFAIDISLEALSVARHNAKTLVANVQFSQVDILTAEPTALDYDIWVSNPPYVRELEKTAMQPNVLLFDPALALFVPDDDPLVFYSRIAQLGLTHLKDGGKLYFEINEAFGNEMLELMQKLGYINVLILKDMQGKDRALRAEKP